MTILCKGTIKRAKSQILRKLRAKKKFTYFAEAPTKLSKEI